MWYGVCSYLSSVCQLTRVTLQSCMNDENIQPKCIHCASFFAFRQEVLRYQNFLDVAPRFERKCYKDDRYFGLGKENEHAWNIKPAYRDNFDGGQGAKFHLQDAYYRLRRGHEHGYQFPDTGLNAISKRPRIPGLQLNVLWFADNSNNIQVGFNTSSLYQLQQLPSMEEYYFFSNNLFVGLPDNTLPMHPNYVMCSALYCILEKVDLFMMMYTVARSTSSHEQYLL